jgi:hypothetical protein
MWIYESLKRYTVTGAAPAVLQIDSTERGYIKNFVIKQIVIGEDVGDNFTVQLYRVDPDNLPVFDEEGEPPLIRLFEVFDTEIVADTGTVDERGLDVPFQVYGGGQRLYMKLDNFTEGSGTRYFDILLTVDTRPRA